MKHNIKCEPSYTVLELDLETGEKVVAESGAMVWMSSNLSTTTSTRGGMLAGLKRAVAGESFFQNTFEAQNGPGVLGLAPGKPGDICVYPMTGTDLYLEKGAYIASTPGVECDAKFQGLKGLFSEGLFALRISGTGTLFFSAYGDIQEIDVDGSYTVDSGFAVAWEPSVQYRLTRARKISAFLFSDQLLMKFEGKGKIWVQSRSPRSLANWAHPFRPVASNDGD